MLSPIGAAVLSVLGVGFSILMFMVYFQSLSVIR